MKNYRRFARIGIATKGAVFLLMGITALITAFQLTYALKSGDDVLKWISHLSFGWFLILLMSIGLAGYIFSRFFLTFNMQDYDSDSGKPTFRRAAYFINGIGYCLLLFTCLKLLFGMPDDDGNPGWKIKILQSVWGKIIVFIIATGLAVSAINEWWISFSTMMDKMTHKENLTDHQYKYLMLLGRIGRFSRGIVFAVFAYILARSAYYNMQNLPKGADAAFAFMHVEYGAIIMGLVSSGVLFYGLFLILSSKYRNIPIR
ncbi:MULTISPECIES: DUF1206 domain-containing protein [Nonlabens]|uniref:DUF1206 domain-containing protein n=1 Tax=Nonlabens TaxID=363408 RepID=UPI0037C53C82